MTYSKTHLLLGSDTVGIAASDSPIPRFFPPNQMDFPHAQFLTFTISVTGVSGAPTTWDLNAKFQLCQINTDGLHLSNPVWYDLQTEQVESIVTEGVGWYGGAHTPPVGGAYGLIADETDAFPLTVSRTLALGFGMRARVLTNPVFTGGASPRILLSVTLTEKG